MYLQTPNVGLSGSCPDYTSTAVISLPSKII